MMADIPEQAIGEEIEADAEMDGDMFGDEDLNAAFEAEHGSMFRVVDEVGEPAKRNDRSHEAQKKRCEERRFVIPKMKSEKEGAHRVRRSSSEERKHERLRSERGTGPSQTHHRGSDSRSSKDHGKDDRSKLRDHNTSHRGSHLERDGGKSQHCGLEQREQDIKKDVHVPKEYQSESRQEVCNGDPAPSVQKSEESVSLFDSFAAEGLISDNALLHSQFAQKVIEQGKAEQVLPYKPKEENISIQGNLHEGDVIIKEEVLCSQPTEDGPLEIPMGRDSLAFVRECYSWQVRLHPIEKKDMTRADFSSVWAMVDSSSVVWSTNPDFGGVAEFLLKDRDSIQKFTRRVLWFVYTSETITVEITERTKADPVTAADVETFEKIANQVTFRFNNARARQLIKTYYPTPNGEVTERSLYINNVSAGVSTDIVKAIFPCALKITVPKAGKEAGSFPAIVEVESEDAAFNYLVAYGQIRLNGQDIVVSTVKHNWQEAKAKFQDLVEEKKQAADNKDTKTTLLLTPAKDVKKPAPVLAVRTPPPVQQAKAPSPVQQVKKPPPVQQAKTRSPVQQVKKLLPFQQAITPAPAPAVKRPGSDMAGGGKPSKRGRGGSNMTPKGMSGNPPAAVRGMGTQGRGAPPVRGRGGLLPPPGPPGMGRGLLPNPGRPGEHGGLLPKPMMMPEEEVYYDEPSTGGDALLPTPSHPASHPGHNFKPPSLFSVPTRPTRDGIREADFMLTGVNDDLERRTAELKEMHQQLEDKVMETRASLMRAARHAEFKATQHFNDENDVDERPLHRENPRHSLLDAPVFRQQMGNEDTPYRNDPPPRRGDSLLAAPRRPTMVDDPPMQRFPSEDEPQRRPAPYEPLFRRPVSLLDETGQRREPPPARRLPQDEEIEHHSQRQELPPPRRGILKNHPRPSHEHFEDVSHRRPRLPPHESAERDLGYPREQHVRDADFAEYEATDETFMYEQPASRKEEKDLSSSKRIFDYSHASRSASNLPDMGSVERRTLLRHKPQFDRPDVLAARPRELYDYEEQVEYPESHSYEEEERRPPLTRYREDYEHHF